VPCEGHGLAIVGFDFHHLPLLTLVEVLSRPCKTKINGRFASSVEFYARYREPYPPAFFMKVAELVGLRGDESLLDIGCGPGLLAIVQGRASPALESRGRT
jgi:hypothetical protein